MRECSRDRRRAKTAIGSFESLALASYLSAGSILFGDGEKSVLPQPAVSAKVAELTPPRPDACASKQRGAACALGVRRALANALKISQSASLTI
jgi:hypothetical protein